MPRFHTLTTAFAFATLLSTTSAFAAPMTVADTMDSASFHGTASYTGYSSGNFANRSAGGLRWGDEIANPGHRFDTTQVTVDRNDSANTMTITLRTMFNGNDQGAKYADIFLDTGTPGTPDSFGYAIALGSQTMGAGLYTVSATASSRDLWSGTSNVYGGAAQLKTTEAGFDANMALTPQVRLTGGSLMSDYAVSVSSTAIGGGFYDLAINISSLTDLTLFDAFDLFWATGDCANDVIWAAFETLAAPPTGSPVPAPASLLLLATGLFLASRFKGQATRRAAQA